MQNPHAHHGHGGRSRAPFRPDFAQSPFLVIWETTQACDLACKHCRAQAQPNRHRDELTTTEAKRMLDDVRRFGPVIFVFSGGDALKRPDIVDLAGHGAGIGLRMAITPATTALCTRERMEELAAAGVSRLAVSLDGPTAAVHDTFRRVEGSFAHGLRILRTAREVGLSTQINTVVARHNVNDFGAMAALFGQLGIVFWEVFFLIPVGRAQPADVAGADVFEAVLNELHDLRGVTPFDIKATAAPHYARIALQRRKAAQFGGETAESAAPADKFGRARGVNDGDGFLFESHTGEIFPSGFLPKTAGNVRSHDLVDVYRSAELFVSLRRREGLKGKCGVCEYRNLCGGSRARAYAMTGDPLDADPFCAYVPPRYRETISETPAVLAPG